MPRLRPSLRENRVMSSREQSEVYYSGRVQGVGFRFTVRSIASGHPVTGYVRNLSDGRVHLVAEGDPDDIRAFLAAIDREMAYYIKDVQKSTRPATGGFASFDIRH